jgi:uncharacterized protein (DUF2235 family)
MDAEDDTRDRQNMTSSGSPRAVDASSPRNLVVCLDGTTNEPETGFTNVARIFDVAEKSPAQLAYYDPGVGTLGAPAAITPWVQALTQAAGMIAGYGIRDNIEQAYSWLAHQYRSGDRIFVFGFSRGAYTARALTGMLRTVGLLHPDAENMVPYALKLYAQSGRMRDPAQRPDTTADPAEQAFWKLRNEFRVRFGNPAFPNPFDTDCKQVHFVGVWDTVKSVGWLNLKAQIQIARWPFTANLANVAAARHALAIDERRRPFAEYRFKGDSVAASDGGLQEMWFAGVHGDIGGQSREDNRLPDIAFSWMVKEAAAQGLAVNAKRYHQLVGVNLADDLPDRLALGVIRPNSRWWQLAGGWRRRPIRPDDVLHPSVRYRVEATKDSVKPYQPKNLSTKLL